MMNGKASELGCATKDLACLCANKDFAYGLRDCSSETCGSDKAGAVVAYGVKICESKLQDIGVVVAMLTEYTRGWRRDYQCSH